MSVWRKVNIKFEDDWWHCWEWTGMKDKDGYGLMKISNIRYRCHRIVYELIYGLIPEGLYILHSCNNSSCCNPNHLRSGTQQENVKQMDDERRRIGNNKLKEKDVIEIRRKYKENIYTQEQLAKEYNIKQPEISRIILNKLWKKIK